MREAMKTDFEGKTILSIDLECANVWKIKFTDGTSISIWSELDGNIPTLFVDDSIEGVN